MAPIGRGRPGSGDTGDFPRYSTSSSFPYARLRTPSISGASHVGIEVLVDIEPPFSRQLKKHRAAPRIARLCSVPNALTGVILVQIGSRFHKGPLIDSMDECGSVEKPCLCKIAHHQSGGGPEAKSEQSHLRCVQAQRRGGSDRPGGVIHPLAGHSRSGDEWACAIRGVETSLRC